MRSKIFFIVVGILSFVVAGCVVDKDPSLPIDESSSSSSSRHIPPQPDWSKLPGALVQVSMQSKVGVVLDEIPQKQRDRFVQSLKAKQPDFWVARAKRQIRLLSLKSNFRYGVDKKQLPLPPEQIWHIELQGTPERVLIEGHDVVAVGYGFTGILLSDEKSPGESEAILKNIGGILKDPFLFPVDPEFIFQRTGFACMNESQFPPNSMDSEEADLFYDPRCTVEKKLTNIGCHQTQMPTMSCAAALTAKIGTVESVIQFERLPWNADIADQVRIGEITNPNGPDLQPVSEEFRNHRFTYRYIPNDSCTLHEQCVGGPGWRKLLMFPTADINLGVKPLDIGLVDYFKTMNGTELSEHGMFEYSACHNHYHFSHYGTFSLGGGSEAMTRKNGFCMQPTARYWNNELTPLNHRYVDCIDQGVESGWIDEYKMGLECQWIDVTSVRGGQEQLLSFETNPDGLLCEGTLKRDAQGNQLYEPTTFTTSHGTPVDKPQCEEYPAWRENNFDSYMVQIPDVGDSYVTGICGDGLAGPLRNCGFWNERQLHECQPGKKVTVSCSVSSDSANQVVRVCEGSRELGTGIPCTYNDALGSGIVESQKDITFICPSARDDVETGGAYSFLTGALFPEDETANVECVAKN